MKENTKKYIIIGIAVIIIISIISLILAFIIKGKNVDNNEEESENIAEDEIIEEQNNTQNDTMVFSIENKEEEKQEVKEIKKDAATLTQEIYNINSPIGTLSIPKTNFNSEIYSSVTVDKMETMPCFLYTTGGLNEVGTTLFVGHNRRNGTLFSNNNKLVEGDKFYFTDLSGNEKEYTIYSKFTTTEDDISFLNEQVDKPTIALSCCTDADDENRIIIMGRAE